MERTKNRPPVTAGMLNAAASKKGSESRFKPNKKQKTGPQNFEFNIK